MYQPYSQVGLTTQKGPELHLNGVRGCPRQLHKAGSDGIINPKAYVVLTHLLGGKHPLMQFRPITIIIIMHVLTEAELPYIPNLLIAYMHAVWSIPPQH
jgi:hypothetical protein